MQKLFTAEVTGSVFKCYLPLCSSKSTYSRVGELSPVKGQTVSSVGFADPNIKSVPRCSHGVKTATGNKYTEKAQGFLFITLYL